MANKNKLSIYLVKSEIVDIADIFDKPDNIQEFQTYPDGSVAYFVPPYVHEPSWLNSFFTSLETGSCFRQTLVLSC